MVKNPVDKNNAIRKNNTLDSIMLGTQEDLKSELYKTVCEQLNKDTDKDVKSHAQDYAVKITDRIYDGLDIERLSRNTRRSNQFKESYAGKYVDHRVMDYLIENKFPNSVKTFLIPASNETDIDPCYTEKMSRYLGILLSRLNGNTKQYKYLIDLMNGFTSRYGHEFPSVIKEGVAEYLVKSDKEGKALLDIADKFLAQDIKDIVSEIAQMGVIETDPSVLLKQRSDNSQDSRSSTNGTYM